jgi:hypothetical protein
MAFGDGKPTEALAQALTRDFGSVQRWRSEFVAMAKGLAGGSGWVLLVYVPRDRRLINQYAGDHGQTTAGGIPILALDMYEHAYHIDFGPTRRPTSRRSKRNIDWPSVQERYEDASRVEPPRPLVQKEFGDLPGVAVEEVKAKSWTVPSGATRSGSTTGWGPVEIGPRRGVLRVRVSRRMQDRHRASRRGIRRQVHEGRPLGVESDRWPDQAASVVRRIRDEARAGPGAAGARHGSFAALVSGGSDMPRSRRDLRASL